ncbi:MAG: type II toxin-antitoxin system HicB family antitoxin [Desulfovibrionaceae bacterium]|nr:type II toxin-antitoxin system HicB family antitoxin [Desulfovibrionaceae bacterium]
MGVVLGMADFEVKFLPPDPAKMRSKWVAICPEINVASQGDTFDEACNMIKEAVQAWIDDCLECGTLDEALRECGFSEERVSQFNKNIAPQAFQKHKMDTLCHA